MEDKREDQFQHINESDVGVYAYDRAFVEDLRARFKSTPVESKVNDIVQITPTERAFNIVGQLSGDKPIMPFVSLQRTSWQLNLDRQSYQTFVGDRIFTRLGPDNYPTEVRAQVIPITINYRLSVYTRDRVTNDALCRELLFYYHLRPSLLVRVTHGINILHKFNIYFNSEIEDNSDIANFDNSMNYVRQDMTIYTDDAYLWRANWVDKVGVEANPYFSYDVDASSMYYHSDPSIDSIDPSYLVNKNNNTKQKGDK